MKSAWSYPIKDAWTMRVFAYLNCPTKTQSPGPRARSYARLTSACCGTRSLGPGDNPVLWSIARSNYGRITAVSNGLPDRRAPVQFEPCFGLFNGHLAYASSAR